MKSTLSLLLLMIITLLSCKSDSVGVVATSDTKSIITNKSESAFDHKYLMTIADIQSKIEPTADGATESNLKKNTVVKLLNETSSFEDNVVINKRNYKAPYEKVLVLDSDKVTWVFSDALKAIYSGSKDIGNPKKFQSFAAGVAELDPTQLESGQKVIELLQEYKSEDTSTNDGLFFMAYDFINRLARSSKAHQSLIDNHSWTLDDYNEITTHTMDMEYHPVGKVLNASGLTLEGELGDIIVKSDISVIDEILEGKVSDSVKEYIDLVKLSVRSKVFDNNNIIVPLTSVVNQANLWTQFSADYPDFAHAANASMKGERLMDALLNGTKTTPAFDHSTRVAKEEYRVIWDYVLDHYEDTPMGEQVKSHVKWLENRDWKFPVEQHVH